MIFVTTVDITTSMLYDNVYSKRVFSAIFLRVWLTFQDGKFESKLSSLIGGSDDHASMVS